jgi:hypothetical protein
MNVDHRATGVKDPLLSNVSSVLKLFLEEFLVPYFIRSMSNMCVVAAHLLTSERFLMG